jgi:putative NIF3 family GTP cyclohydrolase 1 type 2
VLELIRHDMAYYAMHTNFDVAAMADLAAERLGLSNIEVLQETGTLPEGAVVGIGKIGSLPCEMTLGECAELTKRSFGLDKVKVFGELDMRVQCAAVCPGSGKSVIEDALKKGAQVLITGDIDHHEGIDAVARGMAVIDAGHYGLEQIFIPYMKEYLEVRLPELTVIAQAPKPPFRYI